MLKQSFATTKIAKPAQFNYPEGGKLLESLKLDAYYADGSPTHYLTPAAALCSMVPAANVIQIADTAEIECRPTHINDPLSLFGEYSYAYFSIIFIYLAQTYPKFSEKPLENLDFFDFLSKAELTNLKLNLPGIFEKLEVPLPIKLKTLIKPNYNDSLLRKIGAVIAYSAYPDLLARHREASEKPPLEIQVSDEAKFESYPDLQNTSSNSVHAPLESTLPAKNGTHPPIKALNMLEFTKKLAEIITDAEIRANCLRIFAVAKEAPQVQNLLAFAATMPEAFKLATALKLPDEFFYADAYLENRKKLAARLQENPAACEFITQQGFDHLLITSTEQKDNAQWRNLAGFLEKTPELRALTLAKLGDKKHWVYNSPHKKVMEVLLESLSEPALANLELPLKVLVDAGQHSERRNAISLYKDHPAACGMLAQNGMAESIYSNQSQHKQSRENAVLLSGLIEPETETSLLGDGNKRAILNFCSIPPKTTREMVKYINGNCRAEFNAYLRDGIQLGIVLDAIHLNAYFAMRVQKMAIPTKDGIQIDDKIHAGKQVAAMACFGAPVIAKVISQNYSGNGKEPLYDIEATTPDGHKFTATVKLDEPCARITAETPIADMLNATYSLECKSFPIHSTKDRTRG